MYRYFVRLLVAVPLAAAWTFVSEKFYCRNCGITIVTRSFYMEEIASELNR